jgi:hypothetical protein
MKKIGSASADHAYCSSRNPFVYMMGLWLFYCAYLSPPFYLKAGNSQGTRATTTFPSQKVKDAMPSLE